MPRYPRSHIKTSFFHVITQGLNKSFIFENSIDIKYYIGTMYKIKQEHNIEIIAYCIMNNHAHMLLKTENLKNLSKYMQCVNSKYGQYYNKKYNRVGYVFRDRYKSEGIYTEQHLYNCIHYIYNNPVKAGICAKAEDYPFSNYKKITGNIEYGYTFIDIDEDKYMLCQNLIETFLREKNVNIEEAKKDKKILRELLIELKGNYNIPFRKIAEQIHINRETLRKIYMD